MAALILSTASTTLKEKQEYNIKVDSRKNVLKCAGLDVNAMSSSEILEKYSKVIIEKVMTIAGEITDINISNLEISENKSSGQQLYSIDGKAYLPIYLYMESEVVDAYIIPISGKGLWSTLYGYFALDKDKNTVKGITFYKHGETPGLGGEVEKQWFQDNFLGKQIFNENVELVAIEVVKGEISALKKDHQVDGISGATITGKGVSDFLKADLIKYLPFLQKQIPSNT